MVATQHRNPVKNTELIATYFCKMVETSRGMTRRGEQAEKELRKQIGRFREREEGNQHELMCLQAIGSGMQLIPKEPTVKEVTNWLSVVFHLPNEEYVFKRYEARVLMEIASRRATEIKAGEEPIG